MFNKDGHDSMSELRKAIFNNALNGTGGGILLNENDVFIRASQDEAQKIIDEAQEASGENMEDLDKAAEIFGTVATTHMKVGGRRRKSKKKRSRRKKKTRRRRRR